MSQLHVQLALILTTLAILHLKAVCLVLLGTFVIGWVLHWLSLRELLTSVTQGITVLEVPFHPLQPHTGVDFVLQVNSV